MIKLNANLSSSQKTLDSINSIFSYQPVNLPFHTCDVPKNSSADYIVGKNKIYLLSVGNKNNAGGVYIIQTGEVANRCLVTTLVGSTTNVEIKPIKDCCTFQIFTKEISAVVSIMCIGVM